MSKYPKWVDEFSKNKIVSPETGFSYTIHRSPLDYWSDKPHNLLINATLSSFSLQELAEIKNEKCEEAYLYVVKEILDNASGFEKNFFHRHTKRVQDLFKKIQKKEEDLVKLLRSKKYTMLGSRS